MQRIILLQITTFKQKFLYQNNATKKNDMNSRQRTDCATIFDVCCSLTYDKIGSSDVKILYPPEFSDNTILKSLKQFCFPYQLSKSDENEAVQLFTFVRTDSQSLYTFGYCKFTPRTNSCLCIMSGFLWTNFFYKLLNHISTVYSTGSIADVESLLTNAYHMDIPDPGSCFRLTACTKIGRFSETIPNLSNLSTLRDDKFLLEIFNALNEKQMIQLYSSLLKERRIIFTTTRLSQLSSCVFGLSKLCYPFHWQSLFIPILPQELTDTLMAPMPYLIGIPKQNFLKINRADLGDVVIMDLDDKILTSPYEDKLPADAYNFLQNRLKFSSDVFLSDSFARAFLQTNVILFGNYTSGFIKDASGSYKWDRNIFIERERPHLRPFLHSLIGKDGVQYFERFVEERIQSLNQDNVIIDEFEREIQSLDVRKYLDGNHGVLPKPPEFFHQAVSSVKENAADVFGALKDQFNSISVKEKLSTLKQKESGHRWPRPRSSTRKKSKSQQIDPLSIDTSQFNFEQTINSASLKAEDNGSDAASVHSVDDLIDLNEGPSTHITLTNNVHSSPNLQQTSAIDSHQNGRSNNELFNLSPSQSLIPMDMPKTLKDRKNKWETFE